MIATFKVWDSTIHEKLDNFKANPGKTTKIIFNGALEFNQTYPSKEFNEFVDFAKERSIEFHYITGSHPDNVPDLSFHPYIKVHYWPTFWLSMAFQRLSVGPCYMLNSSICMDFENMNVGKNLPIKYPYISMNKVAKVHRAIMTDMLAKHDIIDKGILIWREPSKSYEFKYWTETILLRDQVDKFVCQETVPLEYALSFAQIVPESDETIFTLSEKTAIPLFFNKPFLVAGSQYFHGKLKDMGFLLYDELFDYSFDSVRDTETRYDLIAQNIKRYTNKTPKELQELYRTVFDKCMYNKKLACSMATNIDLMPPIWEELMRYQLENNITDYVETIYNQLINYGDKFRI